MDFRYVREELSYLNDSELSTLQKTLERQKERTQGEERILATVKQMLRNKELEADQEKAMPSWADTCQKLSYGCDCACG